MLAGGVVAVAISARDGATQNLAMTPERAALLHELVSAPLLADDSLDVPGILWCEHLNLRVGASEAADRFFKLLGFVREPGRSYHFNLGSQQVHLESVSDSEAHVLTGSVGLTVPHETFNALRGVLGTWSMFATTTSAAGTQFAVTEVGETTLAVTCPWGSTYLLRAAEISEGYAAARSSSDNVPRMAAFHDGLDEGSSVRSIGMEGIRFVEYRCRPNTAQRIGLFYEEVFGCKVTYTAVKGPAQAATVLVGPSVHFVFHEVYDQPLTDEEERRQAGSEGTGLHVAIYIASFKKAYERLKQLDLIWTNPRFAHLDRCDTWEEAHASRQFRFRKIVDLETREVLLELEHEVRAVRHFQYMKRTHWPAA